MFTRDRANACRYREGSEGHYESYFQRANHPTRPLAFWIRYTIFCPKGRPEQAVGELWAIYFDGEARRIAAAKEIVPFTDCEFSKQGLRARIGRAALDDRELTGQAVGVKATLRWSLRYTAPRAPLLLLPARLYETSFPKAKALVGAPMASFDGELAVDGQTIPVDGWVGSQNHNWGVKHTDRYAWGQVAGFDDAPDAFLECATASVRVGPVYTPPMSPLVLRLGSEELRFNSLVTSLKNRGRYRPFRWELEAHNELGRVRATLHAEPHQVIALPYDNPPGGRKICLNSKLASCRLMLERPGREPLTLQTRDRAAFEILQDELVPGVARLDA